MSGHKLEIVPESRHHWLVRYAGDPAPIAEAETLTAALAEARNWARQFGEPSIHIHELDGEERDVYVDPDYKAPTPADVKGPHVEP
jgi:hypothetical protein